MDREQGGKEQLLKKGYNLHTVINFSEMLQILKEKKKISLKKYQEIIKFLRTTKVK